MIAKDQEKELQFSLTATKSTISSRTDESQETIFLDASTHLYKRLCLSVRPSVRPSVRRSVGPSVRRSVGPSVRNQLVKTIP